MYDKIIEERALMTKFQLGIIILILLTDIVFYLPIQKRQTNSNPAFNL